jgi:acetyl esterase/lipase
VRRASAVAAALALAVAAGCGGDDAGDRAGEAPASDAGSSSAQAPASDAPAASADAPASAPSAAGLDDLRVRRTDVGEGPTGAAILRPARPAPGAPVVLFLHGWGATDTGVYERWLRHLVRGGATVIYPAYQEPPFVDVVAPLTNLLVGVRAALEVVDVPEGRLVAAGHSAGGALAADYAASAAAAGLPAPAAIFSVYPGRGLPDVPVRIPEIGAQRIPRDTRILALGGADDETVGTETAEALVRDAERVPSARRSYRLVSDPAVDDHLAPLRSDAAARATFWAPLDELLDALE